VVSGIDAETGEHKVEYEEGTTESIDFTKPVMHGDGQKSNILWRVVDDEANSSSSAAGSGKQASGLSSTPNANDETYIDIRNSLEAQQVERCSHVLKVLQKEQDADIFGEAVDPRFVSIC
jgi:hypothetical protein